MAGGESAAARRPRRRSEERNSAEARGGRRLRPPLGPVALFRRCRASVVSAKEFARQVTVVVAPREGRRGRAAPQGRRGLPLLRGRHGRGLEEPRAALRRRLPLLLLLEERPDPRQVRRRGRRGGAVDRGGLSRGQLVGARDLRHVRHPLRGPPRPAADPDLGGIQRVSAPQGLSPSRGSTRARRSTRRSGRRAAGPATNDPNRKVVS